jgi:hypothetical protein
MGEQEGEQAVILAHRYLPWCLTAMTSIAAIWLAVICVRQYDQLNGAYRAEAVCNEFKATLFKYDDLIVRSVKLARLREPNETDEAYYRNVWPGSVELPNETCVGLNDMRIGASRTYCFHSRTEKFTRGYYVPDEGPPQTLTYDDVDPRLVNARTDTSYMSPYKRSPWPTPKAIVPKRD